MYGGRLLGFGLGALAGWLCAIGLFTAYVNWFSETDRSGDWIVLGLAWFSVFFALGATVAFAAILVFAVVDRVRGHA